MTRVLLCEDEALLARNISLALAKTGVEVRHAGSASEARAALKLPHWDLVIADISLGNGDGIDLLFEARDHLRDTPVIIITGQDSIANRLRAESIAAVTFLAKPFALSRLRELVAAFTRGQSGTMQPARHAPSVVMYSHDTLGLGHMRRNSAIARSLVARIPGASVLMLVGSPAGMVFESAPGIDYVKLPSLAKLGRGLFGAGSLRLDSDAIRRLRMSVIDGVLNNLRPDLLLVDHEPAGVMNELEPALRRLRLEGRTRTVLGLRDILDAPERIARSWQENGTARIISELYDDVLVYGDPSFFDTASAYNLPPRTRSCGVVTTTRRTSPRPFGRPPQRVLVSGGGGRDAYPLIDAAITAMVELPSAQRPAMTIVTGPLMDEELQAETLARSAPLGILVHTHVPDLTIEMARSDLLITMTGYNSINEAMALGCPIVTVPRLGPSAEQSIRAERLETLGLARVLHREALSGRALARFLTGDLPPPPAMKLRLDGAETAAKKLQKLLEQSPFPREVAYVAQP
ncbi:response regulator [Palleronia caenipelagi]|uniref:Response regulator n=1 Tax=Palleronia caenipelagi TaxID=2489174 RepID=A0A547PPC9_9RHOB|nr:response regulator [Palleronia caenipelagi]TRD16002.1 response regulator [Palleronia caenipelagi]